MVPRLFVPRKTWAFLYLNKHLDVRLYVCYIKDVGAIKTIFRRLKIWKTNYKQLQIYLKETLLEVFGIVKKKITISVWLMLFKH